MSDTSFKDHFSSAAGKYAAYRPVYPPELVDFLADTAPGTELVLDCACGTGQLSVPLARRFARVMATDASASQIEHAERRHRVDYRVAPADASGLPDASADLVTVAQAAHWLDLDRFYAEARRVLTRRGIVALVTYGNPTTEGPLLAILRHFYTDVVGRYWPPERRLVEEEYRTLPFPFDELEAPPMVMTMSWRLEDLVGYVDTWSAVRAAEKE